MRGDRPDLDVTPASTRPVRGRASTSHARRLRTDMTDAERTLWQDIRAHRLGGLGFRRQYPVGPCIVDFACVSASLVLELDGGQHFTDRGMARDERRDADLAAHGFRVLRFSNLDVLKNLTGVLETILSAAAPAQITDRTP
ncbi:endonuclease domain-containing protein [Aquabacter spiritensis]|uniref:Very-short-patch-repair endonuclease n=1 Tax=Aquabacter spiritensis TaxID=933073 RepID=A0A4R3LY97_9HYPH|nr:endonuclease domain-containing protein [Aquabacter spiritensis]TCT05661.1 very-short-patch-repair endonuclease [Aquabacter spiritensis]